MTDADILLLVYRGFPNEALLIIVADPERPHADRATAEAVIRERIAAQ